MIWVFNTNNSWVPVIDDIWGDRLQYKNKMMWYDLGV